ncbi:hypothetical protein CIB95_08295 [Lottiidibacillus patelloidae]|uniref:Uncharacterized protein n=1 Tax=Lottiidibacillus patelloidae TaxID=2670334 RepID=A0A263BUS9_9BACI|nr:hypothetical protein [Lottiidibacillus patelloidae]OZM57445.1 hypothetical protein CIB95_08295 [Lottiidibacillus patelloidae]
MKIVASYEPLNINRTKTDPFYCEMHSRMQLLGLLMPFTEQINWDKNHGNMILSGKKQIKNLKRAAAKNDGLFLWYAQIKKNTIYKQLIQHSLTDGYILPLSFAEPFSITADGKTLSFCSAKKLLDECTWLEIYLNTNYKNTEVYNVWEKLKTLCQTSLALNTPVKLTLSNEEES